MADDELGHLPRDSTLAKCAADETISRRAPGVAVAMRRPCSGDVAGSSPPAMTSAGVLMPAGSGNSRAADHRGSPTDSDWRVGRRIGGWHIARKPGTRDHRINIWVAHAATMLRCDASHIGSMTPLHTCWHTCLVMGRPHPPYAIGARPARNSGTSSRMPRRGPMRIR